MTTYRRLSSFILAAIAAAFLLAGCGGSTRTVTVTHPVIVAAPQPPITYVPPDSSRKPEGARAGPPAPPAELRLGTVFIPTIDSKGLHLIEQFEGYARCAYFDPFGNVYTVGFGQTRGITRSFCFPRRGGDNGVGAATENLANSIRREYEWAVRAIGGPFGQNQVDALDSFAYNLGAGIFTGSLRFDLQSRSRWGSAEAIMLQYDHAGGQVLAGLARRRRDEVALFRTASPPPETAAQHAAKVKRERTKALNAHYLHRRHVRSYLHEHHCRRGEHPQWIPSSPAAHQRRKCLKVERGGNEDNREIKRLRALLHIR